MQRPKQVERPPYKNTSDFRRHEMRTAAQILADAMVDHLDDMTRHCANCDWYDHNKQICKKFGSNPPCSTIVIGCPEWVDAIPF